MNLTIAEISDLPLPAALFDRDDELIVSTPEWPGAGPGTVLFALRGTRLAVASESPDPASAGLLDRLLDAMEATAEDLMASSGGGSRCWRRRSGWSPGGG